MLLTGQEILSRLNSDIIIEPFSKKRLNPNSYNLRLHNELLFYPSDYLDMKTMNRVKTIKIPPEGLIIWPGKLYLGRTVEYTKTKNLVPMLEGRSSVGRLGMAVHITAGFGDVGFMGYWTLEISTLCPLRIYPDVEVCQIYYHTTLGKITNYQGAKYQNNKGIQPSLLYRDFDGKDDSEDGNT